MTVTKYDNGNTHIQLTDHIKAGFFEHDLLINRIGIMFVNLPVVGWRRKTELVTADEMATAQAKLEGYFGCRLTAAIRHPEYPYDAHYVWLDREEPQ